MTKIFLRFTILISIIFIQHTYCQTVNLGGIEVSIGDSLSEIKSQINPNNYIFSRVEGDSIGQGNAFKQIWLLEYKEPPFNTIGLIYFFAPPQNSWMKKIAEQPRVTSIQKFWADDNSNVTEAMKKFYNLLELEGVDKYKQAVSFEKTIEPYGTSYDVIFSLSDWRDIVFSFNDKNLFQLYESVRENEYEFFYDKIYCVFFYDYKHYTNKDSDIITEKFTNEEDAEKRLRVLQLPYLARSEDLPNGSIMQLMKKHKISSYKNDSNVKSLPKK